MPEYKLIQKKKKKKGESLSCTTPRPTTLKVPHHTRSLLAPPAPATIGVLDSAVVHRPKTLGRDCIPVQRGVVAGEVVQDGFHAKAWGEARVHDLLPNHLTPEMTWTARTVRENCKARLCKTSDLVTTAGETAGDSAEDDGCGVGDGDGERESSQADPDAGNAGGTEDG
jgi:hypothetical protein